MPLRHALWLAAAMVAACNSQTPTVSAPSSAPPPATPEKPAQQAPTNDDDAILQTFIDTPALQQYYHVDVRPERKPLVLLEGPQTKGAALEKFGVPVEIVPADKLGDRPHLDIQALERSGEQAVVRFRYDVEGLRGEVRLSRRDGAWRVDSQDIAER